YHHAQSAPAGEREAPRWLVFNVGCIECGVSSDVVGIYATKEEAESVADECDKRLSWREGGQNSFEVFDLATEIADEYKEIPGALNRAAWQRAQSAPVVPEGWRETVSMAVDLIQDLRQGTAVERRLRELLAAAPAQPAAQGEGPDYSDGHDYEGFPGGCQRLGCDSKCAAPAAHDQGEVQRLREAVAE